MIVILIIDGNAYERIKVYNKKINLIEIKQLTILKLFQHQDDMNQGQNQLSNLLRLVL